MRKYFGGFRKKKMFMILKFEHKKEAGIHRDLLQNVYQFMAELFEIMLSNFEEHFFSIYCV